jgi:outer membrane lipoprotein carrier protein
LILRITQYDPLIRPLIRLAMAVTLLAVTALPAAAQSSALERAASVWSRAKTVRGTFEQSVENSLTGGKATSRGTFQQQQPNKLAIVFTEPAGDRIVSDGRSVWIYLPSSLPGEVIQQRASGAALPVDMAGQFLHAPESRFTISAAGARTVEGHAAHGFLLVPKAGTSAPFSRATVWVDDDDALVRAFVVADPNGVTRQITITSLELDAAIPASAFSFTPPAGVRVVKR